MLAKKDEEVAEREKQTPVPVKQREPLADGQQQNRLSIIQVK